MTSFTKNPALLHRFAESYLQRSLTPEEDLKLQDFLASMQIAEQGHPRRAVDDIQLSQEKIAASERALQHLLETVKSASSLNELRPATLPSAPYTDMQLVMAQIADILVNLVQKEVTQSFEHNFGSLNQQLEAALLALNAAQKAENAGQPQEPKS